MGECLHVDTAQCLVDGAGLYIRHGLDLHLLRDGVDDIWVYETLGRQRLEAGYETIFCRLSNVFRRAHGFFPLPLRGLVECSDTNIIQSRQRSSGRN